MVALRSLTDDRDDQPVFRCVDPEAAWIRESREALRLGNCLRCFEPKHLCWCGDGEQDDTSRNYALEVES